MRSSFGAFFKFQQIGDLLNYLFSQTQIILALLENYTSFLINYKVHYGRLRPKIYTLVFLQLFSKKELITSQKVNLICRNSKQINLILSTMIQTKMLVTIFNSFTISKEQASEISLCVTLYVRLPISYGNHTFKIFEN